MDFMVGDPAFADEQPDYLHISRVTLPQLRQAGITEKEIDELMIANPQRFFG